MSGRLRWAALILLAVAVATGAWLALIVDEHPAGVEHEVTWTCAMHPQVQQDRPGQCPICGMRLIPAAGGDGGAGPAGARASGAGDGVVRVDPAMVQNLGLRTAQATRGTFWQRIDAVGSVEIDEHRVVAVESRAAGWIERLAVRAAGERVAAGDLIAEIYSPELFAAQQELALAARSGDAALLGAARQRAVLLGLSESQVANVVRSRTAQRRVAVHAPAAGIVAELNAREGQQVMPGAPLVRLADLAGVWINVAIPEVQSAWVAEGRPAEARLPALPGRVFEGSVAYVYPQLDAATRTVQARLAFDNPGQALKPGMYASVTLFGGPRRDTLLVPSEAVIRTGARSLVILALGEGRFRPAEVVAGDERAGQTEILDGLAEGESIVVSGQFLIDSEASLSGIAARMAPARAIDADAAPGAPAGAPHGRPPQPAREPPPTASPQAPASPETP